MKRIVITTVITSLLMLAIFGYVNMSRSNAPLTEALRVGFVFENDESAPYTYNFVLAVNALQKEYGDRVEILSKNNVMEADTGDILLELVGKGCRIVFINNYSEQVVAVAQEHPEVQFCQASYRDNSGKSLPDNYHTFNGEIYQGRYVSGIAAGMKLRELIDNHVISAEQALVGYVGAMPTPEVISGFTAFLLGVRSVAPEATMRVRYTGTWANYSLEKSCANTLIDEGCVIISHHTDTIATAIACEEAAASRIVYHVGYNQDMIHIAPSTSLISTRINWIPYITGAVEAMLLQKPIERCVEGHIHGNDISAGFDCDWVHILELNKYVAPYGIEEQVYKAIDGFRRGTVNVFKGDYIGVDPDDPLDTCDLSKGYTENAHCSAPTFHYILKDVITVENTPMPDGMY